MKRNPKKEVKLVCPECGCGSWLSTTLGPRCKGCGYIDTEIAAPFSSPKEDKEEE